MNNHWRVVLALLIAVAAVPLFAQPQLSLVVRIDTERLHPGQTSHFNIGMTNRGTVAATNVYARTDGEWRLVAHHGSPIMMG